MLLHLKHDHARFPVHPRLALDRISAIFSSRSSIIPNGWTSNCDAPTDPSHEHSTDIYARDSLCPTLRKANIKPIPNELHQCDEGHQAR